MFGFDWWGLLNTQHDFGLEGFGSYDGRSVFVYEVLKECHLFRHGFMCKSTSGGHVEAQVNIHVNTQTKESQQYAVR